MISQGSTVTVVLLTFEALVVALVPVVVATYPSRNLDHQENKDAEQWHLYSARLGEFQIRHYYTHTYIHLFACLPQAQHRSGLANACSVDNHGRGDPQTNS